MRDIKFDEKVENLVQADVYISTFDSLEGEHEEFYRERVFRLFPFSIIQKGNRFLKN